MANTVTALIRHGTYEQPVNVPSAHLSYGLTDRGRREAESAAVKIAQTSADKGWVPHPEIDTSSLRRAWETARLIADVLTAKTRATFRVNEFDALAERSVGAAANLTMTQIERIAAEDPRLSALPSDWKNRSDFRLPFIGAESMVDAGKRTARHIENRTRELTDRSDAPTLKLYVGHGGAFRHAAVALGVLDPHLVPQLSMYHCEPVYLERRGENDWVHVGGKWKERQSQREVTD